MRITDEITKLEDLAPAEVKALRSNLTNIFRLYPLASGVIFAAGVLAGFVLTTIL